MNTRKWKLLVALVIAGVGALQAWDSGAFSAAVGTLVTVLAIVAIAVPAAAALFSDRRVVHVAAVLTSGALLITARAISPTRLPELLLATFFPAVLLLVWERLRALRIPSRDAAPAR